ncbi:MAG: phosphate signaling complex protein PhoU [Betaproteobacteria bacterium]|nr:phosphate signaling complex protein PhoU [Betaproteobacteria bacterium]
MMEHTVKQYDADIEAIRSRVLQMGGLVEQQLVGAMDGLETGDMLLIDQVINNDARVNAHEVDLDEACSHLIARRQPAASDLRMVMAVIKTITDLERIGDEAKKIARASKSIHTADSMFTPRVHLRPAMDLVLDMLRTSLDSFARVDLSRAADVVRQDKQVDNEWRSVLRQLITFMMEDPRTISRAIELLFIAKSIERIGDHSKNISEYVVYMVKGRDVRHVSVEEIEREVRG